MHPYSICLEVLMKNMRNLSEDSQSPYRDSNQAPVMYKSEVLLLQFNHCHPIVLYYQ